MAEIQDPEISFKKLNRISITLKQQIYTVNVKRIWEEKKNDDYFYYGLKIKFEKVENYDQWLTFIKALHMFYQRKNTE